MKCYCLSERVRDSIQQILNINESAIIASTPISLRDSLFDASLLSLPQQYTSNPFACSCTSLPTTSRYPFH